MPDQTQPYEQLPTAEMAIWRYMDVAKLLSMLQRRCLFLARSDLLGDPFEGSFTQGSLDEFRERHSSPYPDGLQQYLRHVPYWSFVNCWHVADYESAALWSIYGERGIAIRSTVDQLRAAAPEVSARDGETLVHQGVRRVVYIDYRSEHPYLNDLMGPLCFKRRAFAFEGEIRVVRQELRSVAAATDDRPDGRALDGRAPPGPPGREISVDLAALLDAVYVAPRAPSWLREVVSTLLANNGLDQIPCHQSSLDELPEIGLPELETT